MLNFTKTFLYFDIPTWPWMLNYGFVSLFSTSRLIYALAIIKSASKDFFTIVASYMHFVLDHFSNFFTRFSNFCKGSTNTWSKFCLPHAEGRLRQQSSGMTNLLTMTFTYSFIHFLSQNKISSNASILLKIVLKFNLRKMYIWFLLPMNFRFSSTSHFTY